MSDFHSSCILFSPPTELSQHGNIDPSAVGQQRPNIPLEAQPTGIAFILLYDIIYDYAEEHIIE